MVKKQEVQPVENVEQPVSEIWKAVEDKPIEMFGLPNQRIKQYVTLVGEVGGSLYVKLKVSSVLPSLEAALAADYDVELQERFVVIKKKVTLPQQFTLPVK
jgi:hypothetical protein